MVLKKCILTVVLLVFGNFKQSNSTGLGKCPKLHFTDKFNITRFAGRWYEIERSFYLMQIVSSCVSIDLTEHDRGRLEVDVQTKSRWTDSFTFNGGDAFPLRRDPSVFMYRVESDLPRIISRYLPGSGVYQVIDTDYKNFAILWSCTNYGLIHTDLVWIWGREREISADLRIKIYKLLDTRNLDSERLILPGNEDCD